MAGFGREFPHHEILGEIILQPVEAADGFEHVAARGDRRANREPHPFQHPRDQDAGQEIGIHADCFEARPETGLL